ncbi:MAG: protein translocase subunit SecF [Clostridia bacterium]|nr:protein translocase subunit SecF [Clostridia bacterium]
MSFYEKLKKVDFMKHRKLYYAVTCILIVVSIAVGLVRGYNFGIDFTGGTVIQLEMGETVSKDDVNSILKDNGVNDATVTYAGENNTQIMIKTGESLESEKRTVVVAALKDKFGFDDDAVLSVSNIGPSVGQTLRTSAAKAIAVAVVLMLIYIAVRFMWKYGIAAILALLNTLLLVMGFYGVFHITINSPFIAAMLTILGYGINDTIVIFDRIRENTASLTSRKSLSSAAYLVDESIRQTVGRSVMTSLTTIAVMIPLLIFCGSTIRSFILPLLVGVIASTLSSIFIATSLWYDIVNLTDHDSYEARSKKKAKEKVKSGNAPAKPAEKNTEKDEASKEVEAEEKKETEAPEGEAAKEENETAAAETQEEEQEPVSE